MTINATVKDESRFVSMSAMIGLLEGRTDHMNLSRRRFSNSVSADMRLFVACSLGSSWSRTLAFHLAKRWAVACEPGKSSWDFFPMNGSGFVRLSDIVFCIFVVSFVSDIFG